MERSNNSNLNMHVQATTSEEISIHFSSFSHNKYPRDRQQPRHFQKMENTSLRQPSNIFIAAQKPIFSNISFAVPKEKMLGSRRAAIVPRKISCIEKDNSYDQRCNFLQQGQTKGKKYQKQKNALISTLKQIDQDEKHKSPVIMANKTSGRAQLYQPLKKKNSSPQKDKLKPIISSSQTVSDQATFFSVQKMPIIDSEKNRKSKSIIVHLTTQSSNFAGKSANNSKIMKKLNVQKGKWNIQRIVELNDQLKFDQDKKLRNIITIAPLQYHSQSQKSQLNLKRNANSAKITNQMQFNEVLDLTHMRQKHLLKEKRAYNEQESIQLTAKDIQIINKLKISPAKRTRRKFNIPFQTYYYRDLLWKVNFANSLYVEVPIEYDHRLKVFVGRGNNSCMVSTLIARRHWYAFTDRVQQANFVWSQIKILNYFKNQEAITRQSSRDLLQKGKYQKQSILTDVDQGLYKNYFNVYLNTEEHNDQRLLSRAKMFKYKKYVKTGEIKQLKMHNHLINNYVIGNKKALFNTMTNYYKQMKLQVFDFLPLTFHIKDGLQDQKYFEFLRYYHKRAKQISKNNEDKTKIKQYNAWIVKPGQNSNRGNGIKMCLNLQDIKKVLKQREKYPDGTYRTFIVQAYIQRPLLYYKRKFDLRHYMMITCINGYIKGYWYKDGYVRTTSSEYSLVDNNGGIHLTNDAVQKNLPDYGKFQKGNKISYDELAAYIDKFHSKKGKKFYQHIYPKMQRIATDAIKACSGGIDPSKLGNNFQVFGLDFMIDINLDVWLIEINTNPCLQLSCPLLSSIIPKFIENTLELTLDCMFPPPMRYTPKGVHYFKDLEKQNRFSLVYDERCEKLYCGSLQVLDNKLLEEEDDTFQDCGDQWQDN